MTCILSATINGACVVGQTVELRCYLINSHKVTNNAWLTNCDAYHEVGGELWMLG